MSHTLHLNELNGNELDVLKSIIDLISNPISVKNIHHRRVAVNEAYTAFTGLSEDTLLGEAQPLDIGENKTKLCWDSDDRVIKTQKPNSHVQKIVNVAGENRWVEVKKSYFKSEHGQEYIVSVLTDITALKKREEELIESNKKSKLKTKLRAQSLANMGADIQQPLDVILRETKILEDSDLDVQQALAVKTLNQTGHSLYRLMSDIVDFAKIDSETMKIAQDKFQLDEMIENLASTLGPAARDKGLDLIFCVDPNLPEICWGDFKRLTQIVMNLIENALKFTSEGYVSLEVSGRRAGEKTIFEFSVKDSGIGITADKLKNLFSYTDQKTQRTSGVSGLGLSLCRKLSEIMGGKLIVSSTESVGSEFKIEIPLKTETLSKLESSVQSILQNAHTSTQRILIVDDIQANYVSIENHLSKRGLTAEYAQSANKAAEMLTHAAKLGAPYSLILIDYRMPNTDGLLLTTALRDNKTYSETDIIILSSVNDPEVRDCFMSQGVSDYILKPILKTNIDQILNRNSHKTISESSWVDSHGIDKRLTALKS